MKLIPNPTTGNLDWVASEPEDVGISFPLAANLGGTGIANAAGSTLTLGAATSITGGGTLALGGYTLTVPESLTTAGRNVVNTFTADQIIAANYTLWVGGQADTVPSTALDWTFSVSGDLGGMFLKRTSTSEPFVLLQTTGSASGFQMRGMNSGGVRFTNWNGTTEWFRSDANGNFGIGVTPAARLHTVVSGTSTTGTVEVARLEARITTAATGAAATFGPGYTFWAETATADTYQAQGLISTSWVDATNASRKAKMSLSAYDTAARLGIEIEADGSVPKLGFFGAATAVQQLATTDLGTALSNLGLRVAGTAYPITTSGAVTLTGTNQIAFPYAQLSSSADQTITDTSAAKAITYDTQDSISNITHSTSTNPSRVTIPIAGTYLVTFSAVAKSTVANKTLDIWLSVDGSNVPRSNTISKFVGAGNERIITVTFIYTFTANQYFELYMRGDDTGITLEATGTQTTPTRPACPSIILTVNKIS